MRPCFLLLFLGTAHTSWHSRLPSLPATGAASSCLTPRAPPVPSAPPHGPCPSWWPGVPLALYVAALPCGAVPCRAVPWCGHRVISAVLEPSPAPGCEDVGAAALPSAPSQLPAASVGLSQCPQSPALSGAASSPAAAAQGSGKGARGSPGTSHPSMEQRQAQHPLERCQAPCSSPHPRRGPRHRSHQGL